MESYCKNIKKNLDIYKLSKFNEENSPNQKFWIENPYDNISPLGQEDNIKNI